MSKAIRWLPHALGNLTEREIPRDAVDEALLHPEAVAPGKGIRQVYMRRYDDAVLGQTMLLRAVVEEAHNERIVVTVYKTSQIRRYLGQDVK